MIVPPVDMTPSEWAEKNLSVPQGNARPGPLRFDSAPFQRGMLNALIEPGIRRITYDTGAQIGKTLITQVIVGYSIAHTSSSMIYTAPTESDIGIFLNSKLRPMLNTCKSVRERVSKPRGRSGVNNSKLITFTGGSLVFAWAKSPRTLRGRSAPLIICDEIDAYQATAEGNPLELVAQRAASYGDKAVVITASTPTIKGESNVETEYLAGDQRRWYWACPHCDHPQIFKWGQVHWMGRKSSGIEDAALDLEEGTIHDESTAAYACESCGVLLTDVERITAVREAEEKGLGWKATKPFKGHASFHIPELASTFRMLKHIVRSYLDKLNSDSLSTFCNVSLAETYEFQGESADPTALSARVEEYSAELPRGVQVLTAGVDVQADRIEVEVVGFNQSSESWSIDYQIFWGDPDTQDPWDELFEYLDRPFIHESGMSMHISGVCVDTGGANTQSVYGQLRGKSKRRIFGIKGVSGWDRPFVSSPSRKQSGKDVRKIDLFTVGVDPIKSYLTRKLAVQRPGSGYAHFPLGRDLDYFQQLTSEQLFSFQVKGKTYHEWRKVRPRNEALDCRVYAIAALYLIKPSYRGIQSQIESYTASSNAMAPMVKTTVAPVVIPIATPELHSEVHPIKIDPGANLKPTTKTKSSRTTVFRPRSQSWVTGY